MTNTTIEQIETVLNDSVRPALAQHQGNVIIDSYVDHVLRIRLTGKCSGCPSAQLTTEEVISTKIKEQLPQVHSVILLTGVSDDLIAQAKAMMHPYHPQE